MGFGGIIADLIRENALVLFHDYRSGTAHDWSGNSNDGSYTSVAWLGPGKGLKPSVTSGGGITVVGTSTELRGTEGTLVAFGEFLGQNVRQGLIDKRDAGAEWAKFRMTRTAAGVFLFI